MATSSASCGGTPYWLAALAIACGICPVAITAISFHSPSQRPLLSGLLIRVIRPFVVIDFFKFGIDALLNNRRPQKFAALGVALKNRFGIGLRFTIEHVLHVHAPAACGHHVNG